MYCPKCFSDEITQVSVEAMEYDIKNKKLLNSNPLRMDSNYMEYRCRDCNHIFTINQFHAISSKVDKLWKHLNERAGLNDRALFEKNLCKFSEDLEVLLQCIEKTHEGKGFIEWQWIVKYECMTFHKNGHEAMLLLEKRADKELKSIGHEWTPKWQWWEANV